MADHSVDLAGIFQSVTQALAENKQVLNQADELNRNHGDNMVQTFQTITKALEQKKSGTDSAALSVAAKKVARSATSGSSKLYAENLTRAATQFKGQKVDEQGALQLLQMLIGGQPGQGPAQAGGGDMLGALLGGMAGQGAPAQQSQTPDQPSGDMLGSLLGSLMSGGGQSASPQQASPGGGDLLGSLLGSMMGEGQSPAQPAATPGGGDLIGSLLGGLSGSGGSGSSSGQGGLNMSGLLAAGMAFLQARQSGGSNMQALVQAFMAYSGMGNAAHRTESTQLVVQSFLQALQSQQVQSSGS